MIFVQITKFRFIGLLNIIILLYLGTEICLCEAQEAMEQNSATGILSKMQESRSRLHNIQCLVEYDDSQTYEAISRSLHDVRNKKVPPHIPTKAYTHIIKILENKLAAIKLGTSENRFQVQKVVMDNKGRAKIELRTGVYDDSGEKVFSGSVSVRVWNGETSIEYKKDTNILRGSAIIAGTRPVMLDKLRNPLLSFGGEFMASLSKSIEQGKNIDVEKNEETGTFKIIFNNKQRRKKIGVIDPTKGYSLCKHELYTGESLSVRWTANFKEFDDGVWFPTERKVDSFFVDYPYQQDTVSIVKISDIKINDPEFNVSLFHFDLPKGTKVMDTTSGLQYTVGDQVSKKVHRDANFR